MTAQPADPHEDRVDAVSVHWGDVTQKPVLATNQVLVQMDIGSTGPDGVILVFGHVAPPPLTGSPDEQARAFAEIKSVQVEPLVRLGTSLQRFHEFVAVMNDVDGRLRSLGDAGSGGQ